MTDIIQVGVIGAGEGASFLLDIIRGVPEARIMALAYRSENRSAVKTARQRGVQLYSDFRELADLSELDILIDVSGNPDVADYLNHRTKPGAQLLPPLGNVLLWRLVDELKQREEQTARSLKEQEVLYNAGVMLASAANTKQALELIVESALNITGMSAGSLALYNEEEGIMQIKTSMGFKKKKLPEDYHWKVRPGGLTGFILSNNRPTVIEDLEAATFDTSPLKEMGVRSLIAAPLKVSGKIVGILYVDDFKKRGFTDREINVLGLLALQAAAAIDKALLLEKAEIMATTDGLTKLYNHRFFVRALERELRRAERYGAPLSLCMIDVDHFKDYNDTYGHLKGNVVLTTLAGILRQSARDTDIVARYGGEEFAIILSQADREEAGRIAARIRHEVEDAEFPGEDQQPIGKLTISIGIASYPEDATTPVDLIEKSDRALYHAKENGRNTVSDYSDIGAEERQNRL